ncbi:MAG: M6 family metalloprotease domain-containing protein, partial [Spirochaetes bacterium]|nr:M6 family metalloprotease domain-containing protein [Spirochaetota bacterium]
MKKLFVSFLFLCIITINIFGAPYVDKELKLRQPDGKYVTVKINGDEFYAVTESPDGYTLIKDPDSGALSYAELSSDGKELLSTGFIYGDDYNKFNKKQKKLKELREILKDIPLHLRISKDARQEIWLKNYKLFHPDKSNLPYLVVATATATATPFTAGTPKNIFSAVINNVISVASGGVFAAVSGNPLESCSPYPETHGMFKGLVLLIDFPDEPGIIPPSEVNNFVNQSGYTGYGNNGSVNDYFKDLSNNNVDFTNFVTPYYYTAKYNKSYYADNNLDSYVRTEELLFEALTYLENVYGFDFSSLSLDGNLIKTISMFYAGETNLDWTKGLWPHFSSGIYQSGFYFYADGVYAWNHQITDMGATADLSLGVFVHECSHMLMNWPDLYDYDGDSYGIGFFDIMAYGSNIDKNPPLTNPFLRHSSGWENVIDVDCNDGGTFSIEAGTHTSYRFVNSCNPCEFFYIENRNNHSSNPALINRDRYIPDSGLAIWHVDGTRDAYFANLDEEMTETLHYMVSLEQADNRFDIENMSNPGDANDLFPYNSNNSFGDSTFPNAKWWNGDNSGLNISNISAPGQMMSFSLNNVCQNNCEVPTIIVTPTITRTMINTETNTPVLTATNTATMTVTVTITATVTLTSTKTPLAQVRNVSVDIGGCYRPGQDITVSFQAKGLQYHGVYGDILISNNSVADASDAAVFTSGGTLNPPDYNGHDGGYLFTQNTVPDWTKVTKVVRVPAGFSGTMYIIVNVANDYMQLYDPPSPTHIEGTSYGVIYECEDVYCDTIEVFGTNCVGPKTVAAISAAAVKYSVIPGHTYEVRLVGGCIRYGGDPKGDLYGTRLRVYEATGTAGLGLSSPMYIGDGSYQQYFDSKNWDDLYLSCSDALNAGIAAGSLVITATQDHLYFTADDIFMIGDTNYCGDNSGSELIEICELAHAETSTPSITATITQTISPTITRTQSATITPTVTNTSTVQCVPVEETACYGTDPSLYEYTFDNSSDRLQDSRNNLNMFTAAGSTAAFVDDGTGNYEA